VDRQWQEMKNFRGKFGTMSSVQVVQVRDEFRWTMSNVRREFSGRACATLRAFFFASCMPWEGVIFLKQEKARTTSRKRDR